MNLIRPLSLISSYRHCKPYKVSINIVMNNTSWIKGVRAKPLIYFPLFCDVFYLFHFFYFLLSGAGRKRYVIYFPAGTSGRYFYFYSFISSLHAKWDHLGLGLISRLTRMTFYLFFLLLPPGGIFLFSYFLFHYFLATPQRCILFIFRLDFPAGIFHFFILLFVGPKNLFMSYARTPLMNTNINNNESFILYYIAYRGFASLDKPCKGWESLHKPSS